MTRRYTAAEARELIEAARVQYIEPGRTVLLPGMNAPNAALLAAAPALAATVCEVTAERDALWNALGEVLAAEEALREYDRPDNPTTPMHALAYVEARAPYLKRVREAWQALAALREAAK